MVEIGAVLATTLVATPVAYSIVLFEIVHTYCAGIQDDVPKISPPRLVSNGKDKQHAQAESRHARCTDHLCKLRKDTDRRGR